uniref:Uncharacterized protein n=1 Tax=Solanum tuberosum TaxID=4113 RepID=M1APE2_SOLTU
MKNVYNALSAAGLQSKIKVSSAAFSRALPESNPLLDEMVIHFNTFNYYCI